MLSQLEEIGLRDILSDVADEDIFSLLHTLTKNLVQTSSRPDAVNTILSFCKKPCDLLGRQRITKKILFTYLLKAKCFVSPESSKAQLTDMCLQLWNSENIKNSSIYWVAPVLGGIIGSVTFDYTQASRAYDSAAARSITNGRLNRDLSALSNETEMTMDHAGRL